MWLLCVFSNVISKSCSFMWQRNFEIIFTALYFCLYELKKCLRFLKSYFKLQILIILTSWCFSSRYINFKLIIEKWIVNFVSFCIYKRYFAKKNVTKNIFNGDLNLSTYLFSFYVCSNFNGDLNLSIQLFSFYVFPTWVQLTANFSVTRSTNQITEISAPWWLFPILF